jgi:predicted CXXCH cytochrome family protein
MSVTARRVSFFFAAFSAFLAVTSAFAFNEPHLDKSRLPDGCFSCHKGHGKRATMMLRSPKNELCFTCHGPVRKGTRGEANTDIYSVLLKRSNHPVLQTSQYHLPGESLPEKSSSTPRHVSCHDCHNPHLASKEKPFKGTRGISGRRARIKEVEKEHAACYLCHSDSANLPPKARNIAQDFDPGNASFHPVETAARNRNAPSLKPPLSASSTIDCSDCHGNNDKSGPKGPHGSEYEHLLKARYSTESGPESPRAYELCYGCHSRNSILNDASFKSHKRHLLYGNASCFACHASHGSKTYENLISFDYRVVFPNSQGQLAYAQLLPGKPRCFLSCHSGGLAYDHAMKGAQYCVKSGITSVCPPGW